VTARQYNIVRALCPRIPELLMVVRAKSWLIDACAPCGSSWYGSVILRRIAFSEFWQCQIEAAK
jgi:hypothetical protein